MGRHESVEVDGVADLVDLLPGGDVALVPAGFIGPIPVGDGPVGVEAAHAVLDLGVELLDVLVDDGVDVEIVGEVAGVVADHGLDVGGEGGHDRSLSALWRPALCFLLVITTITHSVTFSNRRRVAP